MLTVSRIANALVGLTLSHEEWAKKSLDKPFLFGLVQGEDPALEGICTEELVVLEYDDIVALRVVSMIQDVKDVDINA
jgi:hypothetical protein